MKITKENGFFSGDESSKECWIRMSQLEAPSLKTKVIEVPKFWREDGKQYKVTKFSAALPFDHKDKILLRVPRGCEVLSHIIIEEYYKIEYYD